MLVGHMPDSPGYRELRTYGCIECGVWVTEGRAPRDERFILRKCRLPSVEHLFSLTHLCPVFALFDPN